MKNDLQLGKLKENCLLLKLYRKLRKMFLSPTRESNPQPSDQPSETYERNPKLPSSKTSILIFLGCSFGNGTYEKDGRSLFAFVKTIVP